MLVSEDKWHYYRVKSISTWLPTYWWDERGNKMLQRWVVSILGKRLKVNDGCNQEKHTSMIVPFVTTPNDVYIGELGFFFTPMIGSWKVAFSSGWVTLAFRTRRPIGRMKRSNFGGFRVNVSPTKHIFVTIRFQAFRFDFPVRTTLKTSASEMLRTLGRGTSHLPWKDERWVSFLVHFVFTC